MLVIYSLLEKLWTVSDIFLFPFCLQLLKEYSVLIKPFTKLITSAK